MLANDEACWLVNSNVPGSAHHGRSDQAAAVRQDLLALYRALGLNVDGQLQSLAERHDQGGAEAIQQTAGNVGEDQRKPTATVRNEHEHEDVLEKSTLRSDCSASSMTDDETLTESEHPPADLLMR
eukprot:SAG31_NODE_1940_length_6860_cov_4.116540_2_plen_126_part_00